MWDAANNKGATTEKLVQVAQEHVNEFEHPLSLMHFSVDKEDKSKIIVKGVFLKPPQKFITMTFLVGPAEQKP